VPLCTSSLIQSLRVSTTYLIACLTLEVGTIHDQDESAGGFLR
jgi:hypothetical protein